MKFRYYTIFMVSVLMMYVFIFFSRKDEKAPEGMVLVPGGEFIMGTDETPFFSIEPAGAVPSKPKGIDASPAHTVYLDPFFIGRFKVTRGEYDAFTKAEGRPSLLEEKSIDPRQPVTGVTWQEASDYCRWAGRRLPTEQEWEKAARGADGRAYPWGDRFDPPFKRAVENVISARAIRSPYGAEGMIGDGWEWTADWYRPYPNNPYRTDTFWEKVRAIRGGAWEGESEEMVRLLSRATTRFYARPERPNPLIGFRCAQSAL